MTENKITLGYMPSHNGAICLFDNDGKLLAHLVEDRFTREKYDSNPIAALYAVKRKYKKLIKQNEVNIVFTYTIPYSEFEQDKAIFAYVYYPNNTAFAYIFERVFKKNLSNGYSDNSSQHHLIHAMGGIYRSNYSDDIGVLVADGCGSVHQLDNGYKIFESLSRFKFNSKQMINFNAMYTCDFDSGLVKHEYDNIDIYQGKSIGILYEALTTYLGFNKDDVGKSMGLSSYGSYDSTFSGYIDSEGYSYSKNISEYETLLSIEIDGYEPKSTDWHKNPENLHPKLADLAYTIQSDIEDALYNQVKKIIDEQNVTQVVLSGGVSLNCVANYKILKRLDKEYGFGKIKFFPDPLGGDEGNAMGAVVSQLHGDNIDIEPFKNLYIGLEYDYNDYDILSLCQKNNFQCIDTNNQSIAKLISEKNIVALYQGRSEAGPRALGNRSILYDPTDPNGKDFVNTIKQREWFRPFAGTVLHEHMNEWFDMASLDESPFMMFAVDVNKDKIEKIPAITHVDNTCRVQTLKREQNVHYYDLINEFYKITNVPILFNTSFNLGGEPLVETLEDAFDTLNDSSIEYMYLPEFKKLIIARNN